MLQCCYLLLYRHLLSARQLISNSCYCCSRIANSSCVSVSLRCESTLVQGGRWLLRRLLALPTTLPSTYIVARSGMNNVTYRHWRNTPLIWLNTPNTSTWIADKYADIHFFFFYHGDFYCWPSLYFYCSQVAQVQLSLTGPLLSNFSPSELSWLKSWSRRKMTALKKAEDVLPVDQVFRSHWRTKRRKAHTHTNRDVIGRTHVAASILQSTTL